MRKQQINTDLNWRLKGWTLKDWIWLHMEKKTLKTTEGLFRILPLGTTHMES